MPRAAGSHIPKGALMSFSLYRHEKHEKAGYHLYDAAAKAGCRIETAGRRENAEIVAKPAKTTVLEVAPPPMTA